MHWTYQVRKMPLFEEMKFDYKPFILMVTTCSANIRSGKCHFLGRLLLLLLKIVVLVTTCTKHTRSGKCHFLTRWHLTRNFWFSWIQTATFWWDFCYYSLNLLYWLQHVLHILDRILLSHAYNTLWTYIKQVHMHDIGFVYHPWGLQACMHDV